MPLTPQLASFRLLAPSATPPAPTDAARITTTSGPTGETLVIEPHKVSWLLCGQLQRLFTFPNDEVLHALFTHFTRPPVPLRGRNIVGPATRQRALVVLLADFAHIYFVEGARYVVGIPFRVRSVYAAPRGLILERDASGDPVGPTADDARDMMQELFGISQSAAETPRFFTLCDPMTELGLVVRGGDGAAFQRGEKVAYVSTTPEDGGMALLATVDVMSRMLFVYSYKYLDNGATTTTTQGTARRRTMSRRKSSMLHSFVAPEDDAPVADADLSSLAPSNTTRYSASRGDISLNLDRMGGGGIIDPADIPPTIPVPSLSWWYDVDSLTRELECVLVEGFAFGGGERDAPKVFEVRDHDCTSRALCCFDKAGKQLLVLLFTTTRGGRQVRFVDSIKLPALDACALKTDPASGSRIPELVVLSPDGLLRLYDPFIRVFSPSFDVSAPAVSLWHNVDNRVSLKLLDGSILRVELFCTPTTSLVQRAFRILNSVLEHEQQVFLAFCFSSALQRREAALPPADDEWNAFVIALLVSWIGSGIAPAAAEEEDVQISPFEQMLQADAATQLMYPLLPSGPCFNIFQLPGHATPQTTTWTLAGLASKAVLLANDFSNVDMEADWSTCRSKVAAALHLLAEDLSLDIASADAKRKVDIVLGQLVRWLGWGPQWTNIYTVRDVVYDDIPHFASAEVGAPSNLLAAIYEVLTKPEVPVRLLTLQDVARDMKVRAKQLLPRSAFILEIISLLGTAPRETVLRDIVECLTSSFRVSTTTRGATLLNEVERFPEGIVILFKEALMWCKEHTPTEWDDAEVLALIGRWDLKKLVELGAGADVDIGRYASAREKARDMSQIVHSLQTDTEAAAIGPWDGESEIDRAYISKMIFREDRRLHEVQKLLQTTKMQLGKLERVDESNDANMHAAQQELASAIARRTLAVPVGRAAFMYSARSPLLTEKFPIPKMNFNIMMVPSMATVTMEKHLVTESNISWGLFHNGVASGLSVAKDGQEITGSWVVFNKPAELNAQHAGFLLGLGLNGHLKNLAEWHIYNYLRPKHTLTSVALLLGMSASYLGTMNPKMTKVLSVHVAALLPIGSANMNISMAMQTAGIVGVGLLYYGTQHRRMTEILISELDQYNVSGILEGDAEIPRQSHGAAETSAVRDEGYFLAAGIALGMVNIGTGTTATGLADMRVTERLLAIATGTTGRGGGVRGGGSGAGEMSPAEGKASKIASSGGGGGVAGGASAQKHHLLDKTASGSIFALMLMCMHIEDVTLAGKLDVPETEVLFEYVRPDLLLLRTLASRLVMWSTIGKTTKWVTTSVRPFLRQRAGLQTIKRLDSDDLPLLNIVCGICFAMGIRYAGTGDLDAKATLVYYLDQYTRLCALPGHSYDQIMTRASARMCQNVLALCAAVVMSGSGDLDVLRRIRALHGNSSADVPYGSHLATHLALGMLFVGGGEYAVETKDGIDKLALAGLLVAMYPQFPNDVLDNQVHLQALRHFWVFACRKRCLVVRAIETARPIEMPVQIGYRDPVSSITIRVRDAVAPVLLPPLEQVVFIKTMSPKHWPVLLDVKNNDAHARALWRTLTMYSEQRRHPGGGEQPNDDRPASLFAELTRAPEASEIDAGVAAKLARVSVSEMVAMPDAPVATSSSGFQHAHQNSGGAGQRMAVETRSADMASTLVQLIEAPMAASDLWNVRVGVYAIPQFVRRAAAAAGAVTATAIGPTRENTNGEEVREGGGRYISPDVTERLKIGVWKMMRDGGVL
ncbi:uncharacterized protein V1518DRAFT_422840 [Limtongia smithiae]|uniref:uncharacterized protein n=1 Tax=Limtongia smithiae TaxID=1125753 RepID=UPI0034CDC981